MLTHPAGYLNHSQGSLFHEELSYRMSTNTFIVSYLLEKQEGEEKTILIMMMMAKLIMKSPWRWTLILHLTSLFVLSSREP